MTDTQSFFLLATLAVSCWGTAFLIIKHKLGV